MLGLVYLRLGVAADSAWPTEVSAAATTPTDSPVWPTPLAPAQTWPTDSPPWPGTLSPYPTRQPAGPTAHPPTQRPSPPWSSWGIAMIGVVGALVIGILAFVGVYYHKYRRRKPTILELGSTSLYTDSEHEPRKLV